MTTPDYPVTILATVPDDGIAGDIATDLLMSGLVASVSHWPGVTTTHKWGGETHSETEVAMVLYTRASLADRAIAAALKHLPTPSAAFVVLATSGGHAPFLAWIMGQVNKD